MIPRWIPQTMVDGGWLFAGRPYIREQLERAGLRFVCPKMDQDIEIWVARRWAWPARFEQWYWKHQWWLWSFAARHGLIRLKEEGGFFSEARLASPRFWFRRRRAPHWGRAPYWGSR